MPVWTPTYAMVGDGVERAQLVTQVDKLVQFQLLGSPTVTVFSDDSTATKEFTKIQGHRPAEILVKFHVRPGGQVAEVEASIALLSCRNLTGRCSVVLWAGICRAMMYLPGLPYYLPTYCTNARASVEGWPPRGAPVALAVSSCPGQFHFALYPAIS